MSNLVRYWVVNKPIVNSELKRPVAHFKAEEAADAFVDSEFFKKTEGNEDATVDVVSFDIYESATEAERECSDSLKASAMEKLSTLTKKEAIVLNVEHLVKDKDDFSLAPEGARAPTTTPPIAG